MSRIIRGLAALAAVIALLAGVPLALADFVGRPWPTPFPPVEVIWRSIQAGQISDSTIIKSLAVLVWIAWARLAVSILIEIFARIVDAPTPRVAGLGSSQQWAAGLVAAVLLVSGIGPRAASASAAATPRPIAAELLRQEPIWSSGAASTAVASEVTDGFALSPATFGDVVARPHVAAPTINHLVQRHESFWSIAEDELGDGARWREIIEANRGVEVAPGVVFDGTPDRLLPGWVLQVPPGDTTAQRSTAAANPSPAAVSTALPAAPAAGAVEAVVVPAAASVPTDQVVVVETGDTLSAIAAEQLGDAAAWPQLFDANHGRTFGDRVFDDPNLIVAGWELIVPSARAAPPPPAAETPVAPIDALETPAKPAGVEPPREPTRVAVETPTTEELDVGTRSAPSSVPEMALGDGADSSDAALAPDAEAGSGAGSGVGEHPSAAVVVLPTAPIAPAARPPASVATVATVATVAGGGGTDDSRGDRSAVPSGLGAGVLLSSGVLALVAGRRRRQLRGAGIGARLAQPSPSAIATETVLRSLADGERIARLDIALRAAAADLVVTHPGVAILGAIVGRNGAVDVLLTGAAEDAPDPWISVTEHRWRLAATVSLDAIAPAARRANQPCPTIAHIGASRIGEGSDDLGELFLDLETMGLLAVEGDAGHATDVVRAMAAGVAVSPMAEVAHVIAVGLGDALIPHPSSETAVSLDAALDLAASAIGTTAGLTSAGLTTFSLRARHHGGEAWEPAIVFAAAPSGDDDVEPTSDAELLELTAVPGRGLAVVVARPVAGARWRLVQGSSAWTLQPLGISLTPVGLDAVELGLVASLLAESDQLVVGASPDHDVSLDDDALSREPTWSEASWAEPDWSLMVRLLGPPLVVDRSGTAVAFERSKALELVVWLSQHRERPLRVRARTALWELDVRDATFANVVSDARRALARAVPTVDNREWIGRTLTEVLPLHEGVVTDAELLAGRLAHAKALPPAEAIEVLRPGVELIRDLPFRGTGYLWPDAEGIASHLAHDVTSATTLLGQSYLALGDVDGVFWATGRGLAVMPGHEESITLRMRAHAGTGDLAGVRAEWESYERALHAERWPDDEPSAKLVQLRRELLSGTMLTA